MARFWTEFLLVVAILMLAATIYRLDHLQADMDALQDEVWALRHR